MNKQSQRYNLSNGVNLNIIETDKFKSNRITFYILRPLNNDENTLNALLALVLKRGTEKWKNKLEIERKLEELYGAQFSVNINKRGSAHVLRFSIEFVREEFLKLNYIDEIIKFMKEILFKPALENNAFNKEYVRQEKESLKRKIQSILNNKRGYAIQEALKTMDRNESIGISNIGTIKDLETIDEKTLYKHYLNVISSSPIEIYYAGEKNKQIIDMLNINELENRKDILEIKKDVLIDSVEKIKSVHEEMEIKQGKLVLGYRGSIPYESNLYEAFLLAVEIFGGSGNSKLFYNVREKESLAYYISANTSKYNSIVLVDAGIDFDKYEKTLKIIENELNKLKAGDISKKEITVAKKSIISSFLSVDDSLSSLTEMNFSNILSDETRSISERIEAFENVEKKDIIKAANNIKLDTIYFLRRFKDKGGA